MRYSSLFSSILLVITIFSLILPSPGITLIVPFQPQVEVKENSLWEDIQAGRLITYDSVMDMLKKIESDGWEDTCSLKEIEDTIRILSLLGRHGIIPGETDEEELERDILELSNPFESSYFYDDDCEYEISSAICSYNEERPIVFCGWIKKTGRQIKKFAKKNKKALIIGAVVVVAVVAVAVVAVAAVGTTAAGASLAEAGVASVGAAGVGLVESSSDEGKKSEKSDSSSTDSFSHATIQDEIVLFKETVLNENLIRAEDFGFPPEENGRILGQVLSHQTLDSLMPGALPVYHEALDRTFHPNDGTKTFSTNSSKIDPIIDVYQLRGERALELHHYDQAIFDFGKVIESNPNDSQAYLERATAYLNSGDYESSLEDYQQYRDKKTDSFDVIDFSFAFAKEFPVGVKDSGTQLLSFVSDCAVHPIDTATEVSRAFGDLAKLAYLKEWAVISQTLAPEVCELISTWDTLSSQEQGKLSGYIVGKYGMDIFIPGASAKLISAGVAGAKEVAAVCRTLKTAEKTLALEAVSQSNSALYSASIVGSDIVKESIPNIDKLLEAGKAADRAGLTKAGRGLAKHGGRESVVFPKPTGSIAQINEQGQKILEGILNHPEKSVFERPHREFGKVIDIMIPGRGGVRFTVNGEMIGFLEP